MECYSQQPLLVIIHLISIVKIHYFLKVMFIHSAGLTLPISKELQILIAAGKDRPFQTY